MTAMCDPKTLLVVLLISEVIMSMPLPKSRRRRTPHHSHKHNMLQVRNFSTLQSNTPTNTRTYHLWARNAGRFLQADENLKPGTNHSRGPRAEFKGEMMATGVVRLKNAVTNRYLAINRRGRVLLQRNPNDDCLFKEVNEESGFTTYSSYKYYKKAHYDIYLGVKMNGDIKPPLLIISGQKATQFNLM